MTSVAEQPLHRALGLTDWEYDRICMLMASPPNPFELAVFSLLWSEHCGYKHSAPLLRRFPTDGPAVLQGPGENAGVVDVGDGLAVAFKVESHNHPSAVEPHQGAATGVGGILRDVIAMGARPIALLDSLRFGELSDEHQGWMFSRAVGGIGGYGNCLAADETIIYRNSGRVRVSTIGAVAEERSSAGDAGPAWTAPPSKPFDVLSFDPETGTAAWKPVARLFKRQTARVIELKTSYGRRLKVSDDHPVPVWSDGRLATRPAGHLVVGDLVPVLCSLPSAQTPAPLDLIELVDEALVIVLPRTWEPSAAVRRELIGVMPRADARHYWLTRKELPVAAFRELEPLLGLDRRELRLRLTGPRSTLVPAVLDLDEGLARLIGYYLAEGCCSANGTTFKIVWTFGRSERDGRAVADLRATLTKLGIRHSVEQRAATVAIAVSSRILGLLFANVLACGSRAHEKAIPALLFDAPPELRWSVLQGIFRGDGSVTFNERGSRVRISHATTSKRLHEQIVLLLQAVGILATAYERPPTRRIQSRPVNSRRSYVLELTGYTFVSKAASLFDSHDAARIQRAIAATKDSPFARSRSTRHGELALVPIVELRERKGPATVYDVEVPGTHLFATSGGIVTHNCVGVPTVGGEAVFDARYSANCLVNAMCVGLLPAERVTRAQMTGPGNLVVLFGASTGRDGIGGASVLASQELSEDDADKRPSVQIGDPFTGKKLIEASLELVEGRYVESLQDCGAAGLASSLAEMASKGGAGVDVHLDRVPLREVGMEPWEIMVSESQERMVAVCSAEQLERVEEVCEKWELHFAVIGEVTESGRLRCFFAGEAVGDIPARVLTEECPRYRVEIRARELDEPIDSSEAHSGRAELLELLGSPNVASRAWVFRQYDHLVQSRTIRRPGLDAAVLRLRPSHRGIAVSLDGAGRLAFLDPRAGAALAVLEAARNVACAGGHPLALTDCLNFGNPEKPEIAWELAEAIEGMALACEALGVPVVSGNVSLYNETDGVAIYPTPVVGCVGLVEDVRRIPRGWRQGDAVLLAGAPELRLDGSEYQARFLGGAAGRPPMPDLAAEASLVAFLADAAPLASLVHDASEGGLGVCLAECALASGIGGELDLPTDAVALFGEGGGQAVIACAPDVVARLERSDVPVRRIGTAGGDRLAGIPLDELRAAYESPLREALG